MRILNFLGKGIYHYNKGLPCQDSLISSYKNGRMILAISDGCSSSSHSHIASACTVAAVNDFFSNEKELNADSTTKSELIRFINSRLNEKADEFSLDGMRELYTTLIFAVYEGNRLLVGHVGDGALLCFDEKSDCVYFSAPENKGASNITCFINSENVFRNFRLELTECNDIRNIILFSDGPQKFFENRVNDELNLAVNEIITKVRNQEIATEEHLKNYIHQVFIENIYDVYDDWSMIVTDSAYSQTASSAAEPENMTLHFYENYLEQNPHTEDYTLPVINKIRTELSLEHLEPSYVQKAETSSAVEHDEPEPQESDAEKAETSVAEADYEVESFFQPEYADIEILTPFDLDQDNEDDGETEHEAEDEETFTDKNAYTDEYHPYAEKEEFNQEPVRNHILQKIIQKTTDSKTVQALKRFKGRR